MVVDSFGGVAEEADAGGVGMSFKGRREDDEEEEGYLNKEEENRKRIETEERGKSEAKRSEAAQLQCSRNVQKGVGVVCCAHDNTVQRRQANSNRLGVLGDSNMRGWEGSLGSAKSRQCLGLGCMGGGSWPKGPPLLSSFWLGG